MAAMSQPAAFPFGDLQWGCCEQLSSDEYIQCQQCFKAFHLACLPSTSSSSSVIAPPWLCPACTNQHPKAVPNDETPVRFNAREASQAVKRQALQSPQEHDGEATSSAKLRCVIQEVVQKEIDGLAAQIGNFLTILLHAELNAVTTEIKKIKNSINLMNNKFEDILEGQNENKSKIIELQKENVSLKYTVKDLVARVTALEQNPNNVNIQGVPEKEKEICIETIIKISK